MTEMARCPGCGLELPEADSRAQVEHMESEHPEIIADRLKHFGYPRSTADRMRILAQDFDSYEQIYDPAWRAEMQRAVIVEMRVEIERLAKRCEPGD